MRFLLSLSQALTAIRQNLFRAGVTIFIIALGIMALIVVMTSIEGVKTGLSESFSSLGTSSFAIRNQESGIKFNRRGRSALKKYPRITYRQAMDLRERMEDIAVLGVSGSGWRNAIARFGNRATNQEVSVNGVDETFLLTSQNKLLEGRGISEEDVSLGKNVAIIGGEIKETLFPYSSALGKSVNINNRIYRVIGVFEKKGAMGMSSLDRSAYIPITTLRAQYAGLRSLSLSVYVPDATKMQTIKAETRGQFRIVRRLDIKDDDNFVFTQADEFINQLFQSISLLTVSAQIIALITLLGASVALLNVMLVSVTERTNEIGLRKALGATKKSILTQFLFEAVTITQIGGVLGILLGILGGNFISSFLFESQFVIPWTWAIIGFIACLVVGVGSGFYPARKAARVDPIESLRHQ
ncbi:MAG: ABC transporter permease [Bacteroidota bacterium]